MIELNSDIDKLVREHNHYIKEMIKEGTFAIKEKNKPQEIIIKPEILDTSNLKEGEGSREYRPTSWNEYEGQISAKAIVESNIKGCKEFNEIYPHTFLSAPSGCGKTLFATILAHQINKKIVMTTGGELKSEQIFVDKVTECDGGILFVDEANKISKKVGFFMLPMIEQFQLNGKKIKPFTVIFSTTHIGDLSKDLDALIQRCEHIALEDYNSEELINIIQNYAKKQYPLVTIENNIIKMIAENSRKTPRIARRLLRSYVYIRDFKQVLENNQIVKDGITKTDVKVLDYLSRYNGLGKNSIAKFLRIKPQTFEYEIEPYLIHKEFIEVSSRRKITEKGKEFLNEIK